MLLKICSVVMKKRVLDSLFVIIYVFGLSCLFFNYKYLMCYVISGIKLRVLYLLIGKMSIS